MAGEYLMALDVGGGSGRCLLVEVETGEITAAIREWAHPPAPGTGGLGYDLDIDDIWCKLGEAAREAMHRSGAEPGKVAGIAVTSMRNTTVLLDARGGVLFASPNQDARALGESFALGAERGAEIHGTGGHWPSPLFTASRLLWLKNTSGDVLERASLALSLSDWVGMRLGGGAFAEISQAGETLLFDLRRLDWARELIESLGLRPDIFPEVVEAGTPIGTLSGEAAAHLGLLPGIPIAAGGADTQCGLLGAGAFEPGDLGVIAGTTLPVQLVTGELVLDGEGRLWSGSHVVRGLYVLESNGLTAGSVLEWFAKTIYGDFERPLEALFAEAAGAEPGSGGVFSTLGASVFDGRTIGIPMGNITMSHMVTPDASSCRGCISRALIEGIAYSARANIEQLEAAVDVLEPRVSVLGGLSRSALWAQILSDVLAMKVAVPSTPETSAFGAAVCAGKGAGIFPDLAGGAVSLASPARDYLPGDDSRNYQELYTGWREAYGLRAAADGRLSGLMTAAMMSRGTAERRGAPASFRPRILITATVDDAALEEFRALGDVEYCPWREAMRVYNGGSELAEALSGYQVLVTEMDVVDFEAFDSLCDLRAVLVCRVNPVNVDLECATAYGVPVINTPGRNADAVADLAVAFMIMLSRKLPAASAFLKTGEVEEGDMGRMAEAYIDYQGRELWRKTVGIVGMGDVGSRVARRLRPFGARAVFTDPNLSAEQGILLNAEKVSLEELLAHSDFVTLHAPATENTRGMIGRGEFARMKQGAFFINTARASLVDEEALAEALRSGRLAGAALDVFPVEPPASDDPVVSGEEVIATPHVGGNTQEVAAHQGAIAADQLGKLLAGEAPEHLVNPEVMEGFTWTGSRPVPSQEKRQRLALREKPSMTS